MNSTTHPSPTILGIPTNWVDDNKAAASLIAFGCCTLASLISLVAIITHLRHYGQPHLQKYIVRIIVIVPVYSMSSFMSLQLVNHSGAIYVDTLRDCYEAFVLYSFLALVLAFAGGESACVQKIQQLPDLPHPWPFCCFAPIARDGRLVRNCKRSALQFIIMKPFFALLSLIMLACGSYHSPIYQFILRVVYNISYSAALYGLLLFYLATKHTLHTFKPVRKFFSVKLIIFMTFWQSSIIGGIPVMTRTQAIAWKDFVLCIEMPLFALCLHLAFSPIEFKEQFERMPESDVVENIKEVLSIKDIVADAYHNFMPSYQDYILQRSDDEFAEKYRAKTFLAGNLEPPVVNQDESGEKEDIKDDTTDLKNVAIDVDDQVVVGQEPEEKQEPAQSSIEAEQAGNLTIAALKIGKFIRSWVSTKKVNHSGSAADLETGSTDEEDEAGEEQSTVEKNEELDVTAPEESTIDLAVPNDLKQEGEEDDEEEVIIQSV